jgi:hypothetical protein
MPRGIQLALSVAVAVCLALSACSRKAAEGPGGLKGTWTTDKVKTEWGEAVMTMKFTDTRLEFVFTPVEGSAIKSAGDYRVEGSNIISSVLNTGLPMAFERNGDVLILHGSDPEPMRLRRKS